MAQPPPTTPTDVPDLQAKQSLMAAERTWLAWWRSGLVAVAGALAVGRVTPKLLHVATWPYVLLGIGYGVLAVGMVLVGARRHGRLAAAALTSSESELDARVISAFTVGGVALALCTLAVVIAQS